MAMDYLKVYSRDSIVIIVIRMPQRDALSVSRFGTVQGIASYRIGRFISLHARI